MLGAVGTAWCGGHCLSCVRGEGTEERGSQAAVQAADSPLPVHHAQGRPEVSSDARIPVGLNDGLGHIRRHDSRPARHPSEAAGQEESGFVRHSGRVRFHQMPKELVAPEEEGVEGPIPHDLRLQAREEAGQAPRLPDALRDLPAAQRVLLASASLQLRERLDHLAGTQHERGAAAREVPQHELSRDAAREAAVFRPRKHALQLPSHSERHRILRDHAHRGGNCSFPEGRHAFLARSGHRGHQRVGVQLGSGLQAHFHRVEGLPRIAAGDGARRGGHHLSEALAQAEHRGLVICALHLHLCCRW
eukprot:scaffold537_cov241-Pinguiococcus_pyrenoidosus.AAC.21